MSAVVSVLITVYKRTDLLRKAIESALRQDFQQHEISVIDDSGCFAAKEICEPLVHAGRIQYHANPETLGVASSLGGAIDRSSGRYIAVLNDDDEWEPEFLSSLIPTLEADERTVLAFSDHWIMSEDGAIDKAATERNTILYGRGRLSPGTVDNPVELVVVHNGVPLAMASVFRKSAIDTRLLVPEASGAYDFWISCILAASGGTFHYDPRRLTRYRIHSRMETARRHPEAADNQVFIFSQILGRDWFPSQQRYLRQRLGSAMFRAGQNRLYFDQVADASRCFRSAFSSDPHWKPLVGSLLCCVPRVIRQRIGVTGALHSR